MRFFIDRPVATTMLFLGLLLLGVYSLLCIPFDLVPKEDYPQLSVDTVWQGVSPETIQIEITSPLEELASTVKGVRRIRSSSREGFSHIIIEFEEYADMQFAELCLKEKISHLKGTLPSGIKPRIIPHVPDQFQMGPFMKYSIYGPYSLQDLKEIVRKRVVNRIDGVKGISKIELEGGADTEIRIELNQNRLEALNIHPYLIHEKIRSCFKNSTAHSVKKGLNEYILKISHEICDLHELGQFVVAYSGYVPVRLNDIALIQHHTREVSYINRINNEPSLSLSLYKEKGREGSLKIGRDVKKRLGVLKEEMPSGISLRTVHDESEEILIKLKEAFFLGIVILTVIFSLLFLVFRNYMPSILILTSIAFSVLITFNLVYFLNMSLNLLTLGGLTLGLGLFVDNSVVVLENIIRAREKGCSPRQAAVQGSRKVFLPVLAATLTTMSVFFAFALFQERLKIYYFPFAIVISSALLVSLLVSFTWIPVLSTFLIKDIKLAIKKRRKFLFKWSLQKLLNHPLEVLVILAAIFMGSFFWFRSTVSFGDFFSWSNDMKLVVFIGMPPGTRIEQTDAVIRLFEMKVDEIEKEKEMNTMVFDDQAWLEINFPPEVERSIRPYVLKEKLIQMASKIGGVRVGVYGFDLQGFHSGLELGSPPSWRIHICGYDMKRLKELTSRLEKRLMQNPRIKEIRILSSKEGWWKHQAFEYILKISRDYLLERDIDPLHLLAGLQTYINGRVSVPLKIKIGGQESDLRIKMSRIDERDINSLLDSLVQTKKGELVRLDEIISLEVRSGEGSIDRENQKFQQTVMWEYRGPLKSAEEHRKRIFDRIELPPGFSASKDDTYMITGEEKTQIRFAFILSLVLIFMILASLFESLIQPFLILSSVPMALIGVFIAFVLADFTFDTSAYIGLLFLGGIVVNNAILLVDHINLKRKQGMSLDQAVLDGTYERIRPIVLTTGTTVLGVLPMVFLHVGKGKEQIWSTLALSALGGLISSTILNLIIIPILYIYGERFRSWLYEMYQEALNIKYR